MTNLIHYTAEPFTFDPQRTYTQHEPRSFGKPEGLWVSVQGDDDWLSWCHDNEFHTAALAYSHTVTLADNPRIHRITNALEIDEFTVAHAVQTDYERRWDWKVNDKRRWPIDWRSVADQYDGIIIAPYVWSQRMHTEWYYGWDCASGCIWNLAAIASVEPAATDRSVIA